MWNQLLAWLRTAAPEDPVEQKIEQFMSGVCSPEPEARQRADSVLARILADDAGYRAAFRVALLNALAEQADPERLDFIPRYVRLIAHPGYTFGRTDPVQIAARSCLERWQARQEERVSAETLLRAADRPHQGDTLLRGSTPGQETLPEQLVRPAPQKRLPE